MGTQYLYLGVLRFALGLGMWLTYLSEAHCRSRIQQREWVTRARSQDSETRVREMRIKNFNHLVCTLLKCIREKWHCSRTVVGGPDAIIGRMILIGHQACHSVRCTTHCGSWSAVLLHAHADACSTQTDLGARSGGGHQVMAAHGQPEMQSRSGSMVHSLIAVKWGPGSTSTRPCTTVSSSHYLETKFSDWLTIENCIDFHVKMHVFSSTFST